MNKATKKKSLAGRRSDKSRNLKKECANPVFFMFTPAREPQNVE